MKIQEYIKKEATAYEASKGNYMCREAFSEGYGYGLSKGFGLMNEFEEWRIENEFNVCTRDQVSYNFDQLVEIFLDLKEKGY